MSSKISYEMFHYSLDLLQRSNCGFFTENITPEGHYQIIAISVR